jgi:hypothetical protein
MAKSAAAGRDYVIAARHSDPSLRRGPYPDIKAWVQRFQARPAYQAALVKGGPYNFA